MNFHLPDFKVDLVVLSGGFLKGLMENRRTEGFPVIGDTESKAKSS